MIIRFSLVERTGKFKKFVWINPDVIDTVEEFVIEGFTQPSRPRKSHKVHPGRTNTPLAIPLDAVLGFSLLWLSGETEPLLVVGKPELIQEQIARETWEFTNRG